MNASQVQLGRVGRFRGSAVEHAQRLWAVMSRFSPWVLALPVLAILSTTGNFYRYFWGIRPDSDYTALGVALSAAAFVTAATCWVLRGDFFHRWLIYLTGCLWCRAIDLAGSELGAAVAVTILIWYALVKYEELRPYLQSRLLVSLLLGSLLCQCLPWLLNLDTSVWMLRLGIWPQRAETAMIFAGRIMLLIAVVASEVMCRVGRILGVGSVACEEVTILTFDAPQSAAKHMEQSTSKAA